MDFRTFYESQAVLQGLLLDIMKDASVEDNYLILADWMEENGMELMSEALRKKEFTMDAARFVNAERLDFSFTLPNRGGPSLVEYLWDERGISLDRNGPRYELADMTGWSVGTWHHWRNSLVVKHWTEPEFYSVGRIKGESGGPRLNYLRPDSLLHYVVKDRDRATFALSLRLGHS